MIVQFHTPKGISVVETDLITDTELEELDGMDRDKLNVYLAKQPPDFKALLKGAETDAEKISVLAKALGLGEE